MAVTDVRLAALRRFAIAITALNVVGRAFLGIESSWLQMVACVGAAVVLEAVIHVVENGTDRAALGWTSPREVVDFFLPVHITAMAVSMLLYASSAVLPVVLATVFGVASKHLFRVRVGGRPRHFLNPSNTGIAFVLLLFPSIGIAPPYQFVESLRGGADWIVPAVVVTTGSILNSKLTKRMPLIAAWVGAFALQAVVRGALEGTGVVAALGPLTGPAFILFTFYMITDPATTPMSARGQVWFGASVAAVYSVLMSLHVTYTLFFALLPVCAARGLLLAVKPRERWATRRVAMPALVSEPATVTVDG